LPVILDVLPQLDENIFEKEDNQEEGNESPEQLLL